MIGYFETFFFSVLFPEGFCRDAEESSFDAHVCVCLIFRHKGDVRDFVFFVHQEHGGIAFE